jgi:hypothetical protein
VSGEPCAKQVSGYLGGFLRRFRDLYAPGFTPASAVNLGFYDHPPADLSGSLPCFTGRFYHLAARQRDTVSGDEFFCLIFVDFYSLNPLETKIISALSNDNTTGL